MDGFITYNPFDPFDGPKASDPPPPAYSSSVKKDTDPTIRNPAYRGSAVYHRTAEEDSANVLQASLIVKGQGVVCVRAQPKDALMLFVTVPLPNASSDGKGIVAKGVVLAVTHTSCDISWVDDKGTLNSFDKLVTEVKPNKEKWYLKDYETNYWLSFDLPHGRIKYGIGLQTVRSVLFEVKLKTSDGHVWNWDAGWDWVGGLENVQARLGYGDKVCTIPSACSVPNVLTSHRPQHDSLLRHYPSSTIFLRSFVLVTKSP